MAGPALDRVLAKLSGVKHIHSGSGIANYVARCPAHDDKIQSLQVSERDDLSVGLHCHAGCSKPALMAAMGLVLADLFSPKADSKPQIVKEYDYRDLNGALLFQVVRMLPKDFKQRRWVNGKWVWNLQGLKGKKPCYRLNDLKGYNECYVVEGEKDADKLWSIGLPATTCAGGAKKWGTSESKALKAAGVTRIFILPDEDEAGHEHAEMVAASVKSFGINYSIHHLPDLQLHGDVSDWLMNGGSKHGLVALVTTKPVVVQPDAASTPKIEPATALDVKKYNTIGDVGAAEALRDRSGHLIRYDHQRSRWLMWDEHYWQPDASEGVVRLAMDHVRTLQAEALLVENVTERKRFSDWAFQRERHGNLNAMLTTARAMKPIAVSGKEWDRDVWTLGCPNGVVDLRTGQLRAGVPADCITQQVGTEYAHADCPRWLQFLDEIFDGNTDLITFVHRALGYSLTGDMREQCFLLLTGGGSNGKSVFLSALEAVWGTYAFRASMHLFTGESSEFHLADLDGPRLVLAAEVRKGARFHDAVLKSVTGGESQNANRKFAHPFQFRPVAKLWLAVNDLPKVEDDSHAFWRRTRIIPFQRTFSGSTDDKQLVGRLKEEAPGILQWVIQGCLEWQAHGLPVPPAVQQATDDYALAEDPLIDFITECCVIQPDASETFSALFAAYNSWADRQRIQRSDRMTRRGMGVLLKRRFVAPTEATRRYQGVRIKKHDLYGDEPPLPDE